MRIWKIYCNEEMYPGLWRRYFINQAVAVGYPPMRDNGYETSWKMEGPSESPRWTRTRRALKAIEAGDWIVVQLQHHRIGRIGEVIRTRVLDHEWKAPLVPRSKQLPAGEMGRRIEVRWEMANAPADPDIVIHLPKHAQFGPGKIRPALCEISKPTFRKIKEAIEDKSNWTAHLPHRFRLEEAISDYIGTYPYRLEDGFQPYLGLRVREQVFDDRTRSDVLLEDRDGNPVVVECKQDAPALKHLSQIRGYMEKAKRLTGRKVRGILVHGGSSRIPDEVMKASRRRNMKVEFVRYRCVVDFPSAV